MIHLSPMLLSYLLKQLDYLLVALALELDNLPIYNAMPTSELIKHIYASIKNVMNDPIV